MSEQYFSMALEQDLILTYQTLFKLYTTMVLSFEYNYNVPQDKKEVQEKTAMLSNFTSCLTEHSAWNGVQGAIHIKFQNDENGAYRANVETSGFTDQKRVEIENIVDACAGFFLSVHH
jgi:hypothetical protein